MIYPVYVEDDPRYWIGPFYDDGWGLYGDWDWPTACYWRLPVNFVHWWEED